MRVILFGATGMVGQGVLRECLLDPEIELVLCIGRSKTGQVHDKFREVQYTEQSDLSAVLAELSDYGACFFCIGITSAGASEEEYERITFSLPVAVANALLQRNPRMTFIYVSGVGADSSERSGTMWKRIKGKAENALLALPFKAVYVFRPGYIQPRHGIRSRTRLYNLMYPILGPLYPLWKAIAPGYVTTTEELGRAMIAVAKRGALKLVIESHDIGGLDSGN